MSLRIGLSAAIAAALLGSFSLVATDARACGGCFLTSGGSQSTVVNAHRMAVSISKKRTVLWDQIQYSGSPEDFAWVLPVKAGAYLELSSNAFFEALDTATSTTVVGPTLRCSNGGGGGYPGGGSRGCSIGCAADSANYAEGAGGNGGGTVGQGPPPVTVVHEASIGPYDTVTVHSNKKGALYDWLVAHSYDVPKAVEPVIDAYESEGFDFIALRLTPGNGVQLMKPVRVVSPGASPSFPLRMVAAGTGANVAVTLFVIGEGRWEPQNFPSAVVDSSVLSWDFATSSSNYAGIRQQVLATNEGRTWINAFSKQGALLSPIQSAGKGGYLSWSTSDAPVPTDRIAELYIRQGAAEEKTGIFGECLETFAAYGESPSVVVDPCEGQGGAGGAGGSTNTGTAGAGGAGGSTDTGTAGGGGATGSTSSDTGPMCSGQIGPDELDGREFKCGDLDDIEAALIGLRPADTWLTRLESSLPQSALASDLLLQASSSQAEIDSWHKAPKYTNPPSENCYPVPYGAAAGPGQGPPDDRGSRRRNQLAIYATIAALIGAAAARRLLRMRRGAPASA